MLRGVGVVCLLLTSCSAPSERPVDGGADDDASVDCTGDRDSDGVCDEHDVCPDVADPAQVDLDGDHRGWSCDPVETFSFPAIDSGGVYLSPGWISWDAAAALVPTSCLDFPNVCEHALFAVGTTGHVLAHSDSSDPAEDWMKAPRFEGPVVTSDGQILLSRWHGNGGDTVGVDLSSKSAVVRTNSVYESSVVDGQGHPSILQMTQYDLGLRTLVEPRGGNELHVVATTPQSFVVPEVANQRGDRHLADDPYPLLAEKYVSLPRGDHLRSFHPGMDALTELSPVVDGVEQLAPVPTFGYFSPLNMNALPTMRQPWCGYTAADGATLFQSSSSGVERLPVPMTYCFGFTSTMVGDTQLLVVNPAEPIGDGDTVSALTTAGAIPLANGACRGVAIDATHADPEFLAEVTRVLRTGGRIVAPTGAPLPDGIIELARDDQQWVGEARGTQSPLIPITIARQK